MTESTIFLNSVIKNIPDMIFGYLLTSSNYKEGVRRFVGGKNGYGAKLANIYSTEIGRAHV